MQTTITARHCEINDALRERARTVVERLGAFVHRPMECAVVFDTNGDKATAELRLRAARGELLVARGEAGDHRTALDRAEEKLRHQLDKDRANPKARRSRDSLPKIG